jgi:aspartate kinase
MALIVQKYGGTSVAGPERMKAVADIIINRRSEGHRLLVVVSAMGNTTDDLIKLARQVSPNPEPREMDMLLATGEQQSIALLAMAINARGGRAVSMTGAQVGIITDSRHTKARIIGVKAGRLKKALQKTGIVIVAGFQGESKGEEITTLGRGGSDLTAVALAAALKADACEFYKDVHGVLTTDPRIVPEARTMPVVTYDEMLEMASLGSQVLNARSVEYAKRYRVPLIVRSSFEEGPETLITEEEEGMEKVLVRGITYSKSDAKVTVLGVQDRPGVASRLFRALATADLNVDMIVQDVSEKGITNISFTVSRGDIARTLDCVKKASVEVGATDVQADENVGKVSIVGVGMRTHSGVAAAMFEALAAVGINIQMISTSEIKISCVIEKGKVEEAVRVLHRRFRLEAASVELGKPFILAPEEPGRPFGKSAVRRPTKLGRPARRTKPVKRARKARKRR